MKSFLEISFTNKSFSGFCHWQWEDFGLVLSNLWIKGVSNNFTDWDRDEPFVRLFRNTKYIFCKSFSPVIITLQKVLKEVYNIVVSHLFTAHEVFAILCAIWTKVVSFAHRSWIWHSEAKSAGTQANYKCIPSFDFSTWTVSLWASLFGVVLWLSRNYLLPDCSSDREAFFLL